MTQMNSKLYPIGVQTFEKIREGNYYYVDKTLYVYQIANSTSQVFLSRPRRFGKSLFVSTLEAYFQGRKELFEGLEISKLETEWESYPVLRFSFGGMAAEETLFITSYINNRLQEFEEKYQVKINADIPSIGDRFGMLIKNIAEKTGKKVVVLIDEYDKGIVEMLQNEEQLEKNIATFRPFYSQLKDQDQYLRFVFLTGVSRFRNLTLFSSPNQLQDISMDKKYGGICGLTADELYSVFAEGIESLAEDLGISVEEAKYRLKLKYDSYRFTREDVLVYNPFSILNCLAQGDLGNYWISSGASKVFVDYLKKSDYDLTKIEDIWVDPLTLGGAYSLKDPIPLLFQTGYLTITDYNNRGNRYKLGIPNGEVRSALVNQLAPLFLGIDKYQVGDLLYKLRELVETGDAEGMMREFQGIVGGIAHQMFRKDDPEHIYHLAMTFIGQMAGLDARSEVSVAGGDIDLLITTPEYVYVMEFKKDKSAAAALEQINTKGYALPWAADNRTVFKIGINFSSETRNITEWIIAP